MNKQMIILAGGGAVAVLVIAILVTVMLGQKPPPPPEDGSAPVETHYVLSAAHDLRRGQEVTGDDLAWEAIPEPYEDEEQGSVDPADELPPVAIKTKNAARSTDEILHGRLRREIPAGEPVTRDDVVEGNNIVALSLAPGMRAVSVEVDAETSAGGFIWPGDFVDVVLTHRVRFEIDDDDPSVDLLIDQTIDNLAAETVLQNVQVLAIDQDATSPPGKEGQVSNTVTLALSMRDAENLAVAEEMGDLRLALRGLGDNAVVQRQWPTPTDARLTRMDDEIVESYMKLRGVLDAQVPEGAMVNVYDGAVVQQTPVAR